MRYSTVFSALALGLPIAAIAEIDVSSYPYTTGRYVILKPVMNTIYSLPDPTHTAISKRNDLDIPPTDSPEWIAKGCRDNGRGRTHCIGGHTQIPAWKRDRRLSPVTLTKVIIAVTTSAVTTASSTLPTPETKTEDPYRGCPRPGSPEWNQKGCSVPCQCRGGNTMLPAKRSDHVEESSMMSLAARADEMIVQDRMLPPPSADIAIMTTLNAVAVNTLRNASSGFTTMAKLVSER